MSTDDMPLLGELNRWEKPIGKKRLDPNMDTRYLIQEVVTDRYIYDAVGKGPYKGIVLRVEDPFTPDTGYDNPEHHPDGYLHNKATKQGANLQRIRVRVPEVHACLPMPKCLPDPGSKEPHPEDGIINLYPVCVAENSSLPTVTQGQLVWIDYRDKENFERPVFKGVVQDSAILKLSCKEAEDKSPKKQFDKSRDCVGLAVSAPAGAAFGAGCARTRTTDADGNVRRTYYGEPTHDHSGILVDDEAASQMPSSVQPDRCLEPGSQGTPVTLGEINGSGTVTEDGGIVDEDLDKWDIVAATVVGEVGAGTTSESDLHTKRCVLWTIRNRMKFDPKPDTDRKVDGILIRRGYDAKNDVRGIVLRMAQYSLWNTMNRGIKPRFGCPPGQDCPGATDPAFGQTRAEAYKNCRGPHFGRGENNRALTQSDIVTHAKAQTERANPGGWQIIINLAKEIIPDSGSDSDWSAVVSDSESPFKINGKTQPVGNYYNPTHDPNWGKWEVNGRNGHYNADVVKDSSGANMRTGPAPGHNPRWRDVPVKGQAVYHKHRFGLQGKFKFRA